MYVAVAAVLFVGMSTANSHLPAWVAMCVNTVLLAAFAALIVKRDFPLSALPVIGRRFRKK